LVFLELLQTTFARRERVKRPVARMKVRIFATICIVLLAGSAKAQVILRGYNAQMARQVFDSTSWKRGLNCRIEPRQPLLNFEFRFSAGFVARCPLGQFGGKKSRVILYLRVTPEDGAQVLLGAQYLLPAAPPDSRLGKDLSRLRTQVVLSAGFAVGEGRYYVEAAVTDDQGRVHSKHWKMKAALGRHEHGIPVGAAPGSIAPLEAHPWDGELVKTGDRKKLTILLNATPFWRSQHRLYAWDRAMLLGAVSTLLRQTPCKSVRLVAFNLDQAKVIFEQEEFDRIGFFKLAGALERLEMGTISYRALQGKPGLALLADLANQEVRAETPSDAVIFLGPGTHFYDKIPRENLKARETAQPTFFYFEYFPYWRIGQEFPDSVEHMTHAERGSVFHIHSPGELAQAIGKMLQALK
jgi:hypothetical protein